MQSLEEFDKTFGPDLKSVTSDHEQVDGILCRVAELSLPIEEVDFNPFNICNLSSWKMIMHDFNAAVKVGLQHLCRQNCYFYLKISASTVHHVLVQVIEEEAISIIDQSFKTLRSSTSAFKMLLKFKHVHARQAINRHLMKKFNDVLIQYCKEVLHVHLSSVATIPYELLKKCPLS